jgi:hypothetical protein
MVFLWNAFKKTSGDAKLSERDVTLYNRSSDCQEAYGEISAGDLKPHQAGPRLREWPKREDIPFPFGHSHYV